jgi:DNA-directed RNA polymerase specialized sigma24 family protein
VAQEPALAGLDLAAVRALLLDRATSYADRDVLLAALLRLARTDADAATAVVVCLLPGLRRALRRLSVGVDRRDVDAELVAQTYVRVVDYDLGRRPERIAANLLLDALGRTLAWLRREGAWLTATVPLDGARLPDTPAPDLPDLLHVAVASGVVSARDAALVRATRLDDIPMAESAVAAGLSYDAAGKRRQRTEARLRAWLTSDCR